MYFCFYSFAFLSSSLPFAIYFWTFCLHFFVQIESKRKKEITQFIPWAKKNFIYCKQSAIRLMNSKQNKIRFWFLPFEWMEINGAVNAHMRRGHFTFALSIFLFFFHLNGYRQLREFSCLLDFMYVNLFQITFCLDVSFILSGSRYPFFI